MSGGKKELTPYAGVVLIAFLAGCCAMLMTLQFASTAHYQKMISGESENLVSLFTALGPIALAFTLVLIFALKITNKEYNTKYIGITLLGFLYGAEVSYVLQVWRILVDWYLDPGNSHMEPLFVIFTTGIACLHWAHKTWSKFESRFPMGEIDK